MLWRRIQNQLRRRLLRGPVPIWHHPAYRLPTASLEGVAHIDPRRADLVSHYLVDCGLLDRRLVRNPQRVSYSDLARVHSAELLRSLHDSNKLAEVFAVDPSDIHVDEILHTFRLACGATLEAAKESLRCRGPSLNLLGGFHHAGPDRAGGLCPFNDIAVAVVTLRDSGFSEPVVVLDLDAHPPDGTAECLGQDPRVWIGSLSGCDWGQLPGVDETVLPAGCDDACYLGELQALLERMPPAQIAFIVAGGDVLAQDRAGGIGLTLQGAQRRDLAVLRRLRGTPSVWLPGGGYSREAWKILAGTGVVLSLQALQPLPAGYDSLRRHYADVAKSLSVKQLSGDLTFSEQELLADLGVTRSLRPRFLDYYTAEGIEHALFSYGILHYLERLGYEQFSVAIDRSGLSDRMRLFADAEGSKHLLIECAVERQTLAGAQVLYVHWLTLRDPRGRFSHQRPSLPGQDEPGLGLAQEAGQLLGRVAARLGLAAIVFRPAWFHTAHAASRTGMRFLDPARQGRFEALLRDLRDVPLLEVTRAVAEHRVLMNGKPYAWEAELMAYWIEQRPWDASAALEERDRVHFTLVQGATSAPQHRGRA